jgi:colicin import membrane protein
LKAEQEAAEAAAVEARLKAERESELAAVKIQAIARRRNSLKEVEARRGEVAAEEARLKAEQEAAEAAAEEARLKAERESELAAVKIQAIARRRNSLKEVEGRREEVAAEEARLKAEQEAAEAAAEEARLIAEKESELAAVKIQAIARRRTALKEVEGRREEVAAEEARLKAERESELAAVKIQAIARRRTALKVYGEKRDVYMSGVAAEEARLAAIKPLPEELVRALRDAIISRDRESLNKAIVAAIMPPYAGPFGGDVEEHELLPVARELTKRLDDERKAVEQLQLALNGPLPGKCFLIDIYLYMCDYANAHVNTCFSS